MDVYKHFLSFGEVWTKPLLLQVDLDLGWKADDTE